MACYHIMSSICSDIQSDAAGDEGRTASHYPSLPYDSYSQVREDNVSGHRDIRIKLLSYLHC